MIITKTLTYLYIFHTNFKNTENIRKRNTMSAQFKIQSLHDWPPLQQLLTSKTHGVSYNGTPNEPHIKTTYTPEDSSFSITLEDNRNNAPLTSVKITGHFNQQNADGAPVQNSDIYDTLELNGKNLNGVYGKSGYVDHKYLLNKIHTWWEKECRDYAPIQAEKQARLKL